MHTDKLDETNFLLYAAKHYDNPSCFDTLEFYEDLNRFKYLKRLFSRYEETGEIKERLILNHIIVLYNVFGEAATNMMFYKIDEQNWDVLVTFLVYLERMPEFIPQYGIKVSDVILDETVINALRKI